MASTSKNHINRELADEVTREIAATYAALKAGPQLPLGGAIVAAAQCAYEAINSDGSWDAAPENQRQWWLDYTVHTTSAFKVPALYPHKSTRG